MQFTLGTVHGLTIKPLSKYHDKRGWLCEMYREDEVPTEFHPVMAYASVTEPNVARGPHEHVDQSDYFCFMGPSNFKVYLWDTRANSPTKGIKQVLVVGQDQPMLMIVPPGVVHAYKNVGDVPGLVFNAPNKLYKGPGKKEPVDEIRHEELENSPFVMD